MIGFQRRLPDLAKRSSIAPAKGVQRQSMDVGKMLTVPPPVRNAALRERGDQATQARFGPLVQVP